MNTYNLGSSPYESSQIGRTTIGHSIERSPENEVTDLSASSCSTTNLFIPSSNINFSSPENVFIPPSSKSRQVSLYQIKFETILSSSSSCHLWNSSKSLTKILICTPPIVYTSLNSLNEVAKNKGANHLSMPMRKIKPEYVVIHNIHSYTTTENLPREPF